MSASTHPDITDRPTAKPAGAGLIVAIAFASLGLWVATLTPVISTLQLKVSSLDPDPVHRTIDLSIVLGIGALLGIVVNPLAGRLSDRTTARMGMRRPWLIGGALVSFVGAVVAGVAPGLPLLVVGWCLCQIGNNTVMSVLFALLPDHIPDHRRGLVGALIGVAQALAAIVGGGIAAALAATAVAATLIVPGAIGVVLIAVLCIVLRDRRLAVADRPPFPLRAVIASFWVNPRRFPSFGWAWWSRVAIFMTISTALNYQVLFLSTQLHLSTAAAVATVPLGLAIQTPGLIIASIVCGSLSDRFGRRRIFVLVAALVAGTGCVIFAYAPSVPAYFVAMVLIGLGQGVYFSVDAALVSEVLPDQVGAAAKDFGVMNLANLLPQSIAPAIAPALLSIPILSTSAVTGANYTALFLVGAVFAVLSGIFIARVRGAR